MANKTAIIYGTIEFKYSHPTDIRCACCPHGLHAFSRTLELDDWDSNSPSHLPKDPNLFLREFAATHDNAGKRFRITIEVLDEQ